MGCTTLTSIDKDDCVLLGAICGGALELGIWETLSVVSANGRFYVRRGFGPPNFCFLVCTAILLSGGLPSVKELF